MYISKFVIFYLLIRELDFVFSIFTNNKVCAMNLIIITYFIIFASVPNNILIEMDALIENPFETYYSSSKKSSKFFYIVVNDIYHSPNFF